ncbi:ferredoxin [Rhodococcus sp. Leaf7]|uniref:Rieske (2Fe-2S) protein n=1 Tax=unclassified Rhodococcus (in: high G+C Gram-positive bacteria) TaxID=192944 RepID=UPI0006F972AE|nr:MULTISPECIES: Rieske (2Fe-2S) protein [unclassified Rhodococcus (in: high G+C Gram-positive bacteria)]KQU07132.1 ferredoxin [Rhodococcus sp. Leaf7]KQU42650.1 ferredoxin [Rhodococcus sp. Leaf247]
MAKYIVANSTEIAPGERKIVELEGRSIGVFNVDGEYFALLNQCPHAGAALCEHGTIFGVSAADGPDTDIEYQRGQSLRCPWHQWEFNIRTGESWYDPRRTKVRKYEVDVMAGSPEDVTDPDGGLQKGPHVMEGYAISLEENVVVVDTSRRRAGTQRNREAEAVAK